MFLPKAELCPPTVLPQGLPHATAATSNKKGLSTHSFTLEIHTVIKLREATVFNLFITPRPSFPAIVGLSKGDAASICSEEV